MTINQYALLKEDNTIINIVVVDSEDTEILENLISFHEASYSLNIDEVGHPRLVTDTWNSSTSSWDTIEVVFDPSTLDMTDFQIIEENKRA
jgi:hypothetical protein